MARLGFSTFEPGGTELGQALRTILLGTGEPPVPMAEALLMAADRAQDLAQVIEPVLERGIDVISGHHVASTIAYQGYRRCLDLAKLETLHLLATQGLVADLTIPLDLPVELAQERRRHADPDRLEALAELVAAAGTPVHAYLFLGPAGTNKDKAAVAFAAMILCEQGGCGTCVICQRVLTAGHPDLVIAEPVGVAYKVEELGTIGQVAFRRPLEAPKTVIIVREAQAVGLHFAALLKTFEEPPDSTVFILVADDLPRWLQTITSRCVVVRFRALSPEVVAGWLAGRSR